MFESLQAFIKNWATTTTDRQKLQHTYLFLIVLVTFVAGVVTLLDAEKGHKVMYAVIVMTIAFLANALTWNLLNSAVLGKLTPAASTRRKK